MPILSRFRSLWRNLLRRSRIERDLDDELSAIVDALVEEKVQRGMTPEEAGRAARLELGGVESIKERVRDVRAGALLMTFVQDVRYAVRLLARSPVFAVFTVASLALGIGGTTAIFTLFDHIALRTLPVPEPERLVVASFGRPGTTFNYSLPYPQFEGIRQRATTLEGVFAIYPLGRVTVALGGQSEIAEGLFVSGDYYATLRLSPALGRLLGPADDRPGQAVAVISHAYWQRRFAGRMDILGIGVTLNQMPFTIVGVEPQGFGGIELGRPYDISLPMRASEMFSDGSPLWDRAFATWIYVTGRLKPGVALEQAEAETKEIFRQTGVDAAKSPQEIRLATEHVLRLEPGAVGTASGLRTGYAQSLQLLLGFLAVVLLLASLNVATLLLSRSYVRQREIATRLALGAGRWRLVRQLLTESLVLAAVSAGLGLALASWGSRLLLSVALPAAERPPVEMAPDVRMLLFTAAISALTCMVVGLVPAIRATASRRASLIQQRQHVGDPRERFLDRVLVGSQIALSLVLLVGAGLFLRTLGSIWSLDPGYDRHNVVMFSLDARLAGQRGEVVPQTYRRVLDELRTVPGARSVTVSAVRPVSDSYYFIDVVRRLGDTVLSEGQGIRVAFNNVAPGYFSTLGIPLMAGRDFDDRDSLGAPNVVIISGRMARHFEGNPVGQRIGGGPDSDGHEVIGVVQDIRYARVKDAPREVLYYPMFQAEPRQLWYAPTFEIRYAGAADEVLQSAREAVARVNPALVPFRMTTLDAETRDSLSRERLLAMLTSYFGGFAVLLACIGLFGLMSYRVTRRTPEMGLRLALGATPAAIRWLVLREGGAMLLIGAIAGFAGSLALVPLVRSQLFGIETHDPVALMGATVLLLVVASAAAYLPARRASRTEPMLALRHE